jgi:hypothetical protein
MRLQATFVAAVALCAAAATAPADAEIMYTFTPLDQPAAYSTEPLDINDNGVIVGTYLDETYADQHRPSTALSIRTMFLERLT